MESMENNGATPLPCKFQRRIDAMRSKVLPLRGLVRLVSCLADSRGELELTESPREMLRHIATDLDGIVDEVDRLEELKPRIEELEEKARSTPRSTCLPPSDSPDSTTKLGTIKLKKNRR